MYVIILSVFDRKTLCLGKKGGGGGFFFFFLVLG
jgi:hypothetical protein